MKIFEKQHCGCGKKECYYCWLKGRAYTTTIPLYKRPAPEAKAPEDVFCLVCKLTGADPEDVKSKSRKLNVVVVRQIYCMIAKELTNATMQEIGSVINRDYSTAIYSSKQAKNNIGAEDKPTMKVFNTIEPLVLGCKTLITFS